MSKKVKNNKEKNDNKLLDSDELKVKMKINEVNDLPNISSNNDKKIINSTEAKMKIFMKSQNDFDKLILNFIQDQRKWNRKIEKMIIKNEKELESLKYDLLLLKKMIAKK